MRPRAILLDALGTLLELKPPAPRLKDELARRYAVDVSAAEAGRAIGAEIAFYRAHLDEGRDAQSLTLLRQRCAGELRRALPDQAQRRLPPAGDLVAALLASLEFEPYPDARPALVGYRAQGMALVVVSNWDVSLRSVLDNVGLGGLLDDVLTAAEVGARNPAPGIFEQALLRAGVRAEEAIHVGDSPDEDVAGARLAGIEPVLIARDGRPALPGVRTVLSLAEPLF